MPTSASITGITGALIGIALVLTAVFIPMAFFAGSVGVIYRQFSVTIATAMILSALVAIILTPALCAMMVLFVAFIGAAHGRVAGGVCLRYPLQDRPDDSLAAGGIVAGNHGPAGNGAGASCLPAAGPA